MEAIPLFSRRTASPCRLAQRQCVGHHGHLMPFALQALHDGLPLLIQAKELGEAVSRRDSLALCQAIKPDLHNGQRTSRWVEAVSLFGAV